MNRWTLLGAALFVLGVVSALTGSDSRHIIGGVVGLLSGIDFLWEGLVTKHD